MKNYGFVKVAAAAPSVRVGDCNYNTDKIITLIEEAEDNGVSVMVFPELCITAYTCQDLFFQQVLLDKAILSVEKICSNTATKHITAIVGMPLAIKGRLYNVAVVISSGKIQGIVPKIFLPNYGEFYEKRWFSSGSDLVNEQIELCGQSVPVSTDMIFEKNDFRFAVEICEDLWTAVPPSGFHALKGAEIILNLTASNETTGKDAYRKQLISQQSARCIAGYVYAAAGNGESTTDLVFSGDCIIAENGSVLETGERFSFDSRMIVSEIDVEKLRNDRIRNKTFSVAEYDFLKHKEYIYITIDVNNIADISEKEFTLTREINPTPFIPSGEILDERCNEVFSIQVGGLAKRLMHINMAECVIGVSGGLDSTLALLVIVKTFDKLNISRENIIGITMPGFGTTDRTYLNAISLMKSLGVTIREVSIVPAVLQHFKDIGHSPDMHDTTYENSQARERTQILMDYANKVNGIVVGTGDMSELALGWCTYNGDQMSMYGVNAGIPKTLVKTLISWIATSQLDDGSKEILLDILDTPISPELLPAGDNGEIIQVTEDTLGPYVLHDFFLYNMIRHGFEPAKIYYLSKYAFEGQFDDKTILKWLKVFYRRFFSQQFKRSCMPDGPKVGSINLSPRGDWRMASDASSALWLEQLDSI